MNITVFGTGYVGLVTGVCLAELGNDVLCIDIDEIKIGMLNSGEVPIHEPGLHELIARNQQAGRLGFSSNPVRGVKHGVIQFIAVGTPSSSDGTADLKYVFNVAQTIAEHMESFKVVVNKSTVPVGSAKSVRESIQSTLAQRCFNGDPPPEFAVVSNPEFLKEGNAIDDFMHPDRIILGFGDSPAERQAGGMMRELYQHFNHDRERVICMDARSAEFTKYAANAMLATRVSFINEMANIAEHLEVDIENVRIGIGSDSRIGESFLHSGVGYGGSCFPKDVAALTKMGRESGSPMRILEAVADVNEAQRLVLLRKLTKRLGDDLSNRRLAIWGLAFKPDTNDMREAPSRTLIRELLERGATLRVYDPVAMDEARQCLAVDLSAQPDLLTRIEYAEAPLDAVTNADALLIITEWQVFRNPDFDALRKTLRTSIIVDGRNIYEPRSMHAMGFEYFAMGRRF